MNGSIDPASVPHSTTPTRLIATVAADADVVRAVGVEQPLPQHDAREADQRQHHAQAHAGDELAPDDAPPVAQPHLAQRHRPDDQRRRLRSASCRRSR